MRALRPVIVVLILLWCLPAVGAGNPCSEPLQRAMAESGLNQAQIRAICQRAAEIKADERPVITAEQVERDIAGKIVGTWIFQKSEWRDIDIVEAEYTGDTAKIVANIDTIRNKTGRLRLRYKWTDGHWKIYRLFNIDFE